MKIIIKDDEQARQRAKGDLSRVLQTLPIFSIKVIKNDLQNL